MFSLGNFHNLVGQNSEQPALTGASPASSGRLDLRTFGFFLQIFFFPFFSLGHLASLALLAPQYMFSKGCCFLGWLTTGSFGLFWVRVLLWWHQRAVGIGCLWLHVAAADGANQVPSCRYSHMSINQHS